jgi:hypothetical protein
MTKVDESLGHLHKLIIFVKCCVPPVHLRVPLLFNLLNDLFNRLIPSMKFKMESEVDKKKNQFS